MPQAVSVDVARDVACLARDGIALRCDIYRPADSGEVPVLVCRTPYGKHDPWLAGMAITLAERGYIVVLQDQRGRYASDGEYTWMWIERTSTGDDGDGFDTVEWAARLAGSSGVVGAFGHSNDGWSVFTMLSARPPSLRAAAVGGMSPNARDFTFGLFETGRRLQWIYEMAADLRRRRGLPGLQNAAEATEAWRAGEGARILGQLPLASIGPEDFADLTDPFRQLVRAPEAEWLHLDDIYPAVSVPMLLVTGWWDRFVDTVEHLPGLVREGDPSVRHRHRAIVGPWGHEPSRFDGRVGPIDHGPAADIDYATLLGDWFDLHLKGVDSGRMAERAPVSLFVLGDDHWRSESAWPPKNVGGLTLYLSSGGSANTAAGDGRLTPALPHIVDSVPDGFAYDPTDPVPSIVDADTQVVPLDQSARGERPDVLMYQTAILDEPITLIGRVELVLWAASDAPDTDWMATLAIVHPDGLTVNLTYGACRARFRNGFDQATSLTSSEPVEYRIRMHPLGCTFPPGSRVRLYVSSSDFPLFDRNHNTGLDDLHDPSMRVAQQTVFHSVEMPSRLELPLMPASA